MTGNHDQQEHHDWDLAESQTDSRPVIVLVRPQLGENIGACCRAMLNFGLEDLRIVSPRDGWPNPSAVAMASGAERILDSAQIHESTEDALSGLNFVFATTARTRDLTKTIMSPRSAMCHARKLTREGSRVGILFGPERSGLTNDDVVLANAIVTVPVNPEFMSLNIAQSVLLLAYEWWVDADTNSSEPELAARHNEQMAEFSEVQLLADRLESELASRGFFTPETKASRMKLNLRNLFSRLPLTRGDIGMCHGVIRTLANRQPCSDDVESQ